MVNVNVANIDYNMFDTRITVKYNMYNIIKNELRNTKTVQDQYSVVLYEKDGGRYGVIDGNLRVSCCIEEGIKKIPAIIANVSDVADMLLCKIKHNTSRELSLLEVGINLREIHKFKRCTKADLVRFKDTLCRHSSSVTVSMDAAEVYEYIMASGAFGPSDKLILRTKAHHLYLIKRLDKKFWVDVVKYMINDDECWTRDFVRGFVDIFQYKIRTLTEEYINNNMTKLIDSIAKEYRTSNKKIRYINVQLLDGSVYKYNADCQFIVDKAISQIMQTGIRTELKYIPPSAIDNVEAV